MRLHSTSLTFLFGVVTSCTGVGTVSDPGYQPTTTSTTGGSTFGGAGSGSNAAASGSNTTGSGCKAIGAFAGIGDDMACCSGLADASGYCESTTASTSSGSTMSAAAATGTSTGGQCPMNMPNIDTGVTQSSGPCTHTELGDNCPTGFQCINDVCILNGAEGGVQVTMSWDDPEDLDLHVREPQASQHSGYCEIWWGNVGNRIDPDGGLDPNASTSICTPIGWLDRDSNPGCDLDNVDIENVIYPSNVPPPAGTYSVYADYYADCADPFQNIPQYQHVYYAIQVRANGMHWTYCQAFTPSDANGGAQNSGTEIATFTVP